MSDDKRFDPASLSEHEAQNRRSWNIDSDTYQKDHGHSWARRGMAWGVWQISEASLQIMVRSGGILDELGCGAAQWSISLAKAGALPRGARRSGEAT